LQADAFVALWRQVAPAVSAGNAEAIAALLSSGSNWLPNAVAAGIAAEASLDRLYMLPGFGCIAEGWALSPAKRVQTFQMKIGDCLLVADDTATYYKPRPDLPAAAEFAAPVQRAGFVTVLRGAVESAASGAPLLRVMFDDGTSVVQRVDLNALRLLDPLADSAEILRLYPSLPHEPFYPAFVAALRRQAQAQAYAHEPLGLFVGSPAAALLVIRLPAARNNLALCFDAIASHAARLAPNIAVCLVADRTAALAEAKRLFDELRTATPLALSLFCIADRAEGFAELPHILARMKADRFAYVGQGLALAGRGWETIAKRLAATDNAIDFFEIVDDADMPDRVHGAWSAACFSWNTAALLEWLPGAPWLSRAVCGTSGLPAAQPQHCWPAAAIRVERPLRSRLTEIIDEHLLAHLADRVDLADLASHGTAHDDG
jgi:hypothetical protein